MIVAESVWQSDRWKNFQSAVDNKAFWIEKGNARALVIERSPHFLKFWKRAFWEIPRGPIGDSNDFDVLLNGICEEASKQRIAFVRIYPPRMEEKVFWSSLALSPTWKSAPEIFPEETLMLDLTKSEEILLAEMKQKGRYNVRLAEKKGVVVREEHTTKNFWKLLEETAVRDHFCTNPRRVYDGMLRSFGEDRLLVTAFSPENDLLASALFVLNGENAVYYYGASSNTHRQFMAPYLLQWKGICWAKQKGAKTYDFLGISPEDKPDHRLASVSDFKLKFGGTRVRYEAGRDYITRL